MKKYLFSALALPLLFACSTDDFEKPMASNNDPYPGIQKVNAAFYMDEGPVTRMETYWGLEAGDVYGFAWMGDGECITPEAGEGKAYQNHNLIQTNVPELGGDVFMPQTSIYVGDYYIYRPYDYTTVSPQAINFNSLKEQPMAKGYESSTAAWKGLAKSAIIIGDKWTNITPDGRTYNPANVNDFEAGGDWDLPGIAKPYKVFAAFFSNQTGLDLTYVKNNPTFENAQPVKGATDIDYTIAAGESAGAADIYGATVQLNGAANSFTYDPTESPNGDQHNGEFWADKDKTSDCITDGCNFAAAAPIVLKAPAGSPIETGAEGSKGWFWFNSLPVTSGDAAIAATPITTTVQTSYGTVTVNSTVGDCAWAFEVPTGGAAKEWMKLTDGEDNLTLATKRWNITDHNTFVNQFGNHKGKYSLDVDFSKAEMDIHITNDAHLQKYLKFYLASGKTGGANLVLDGAAENDTTFEISKISIALLQTINRNLAAGAKPVKVAPCVLDDHHAGPKTHRVKIVVNQDGQTGALADMKAVPDLADVFATKAKFENDEVDVAAVPVYLSSKCTWTWGSEIGTEGNGILPIDEQVASITNEGTLNVTNTNVQLSEIDAEVQPTIYNANGATMNVKAKTAVKNNLHNLGVINVEAKKELRAYGVNIINDAADLLMPTDIITNDPAVPADKKVGLINNYGVVGVSANTDGKFYNYGKIIMKTADAITLLTSNEKSSVAEASAFGRAFKDNINNRAQDNKMGTVVLPEGEPEAIVSVSNTAENGFIMYKWDAATYSHATGNIKYNTIIVDKDIEFTGEERSTEIQFILFNGVKTKVVNPGVPVAASRLSKLKGIIVNDGKSVIIEKTNRLNCLVGAYLGEDATVYRGGVFDVPETAENNYFGDWVIEEQVVEW